MLLWSFNIYSYLWLRVLFLRPIRVRATGVASEQSSIGRGFTLISALTGRQLLCFICLFLPVILGYNLFNDLIIFRPCFQIWRAGNGCCWVAISSDLKWSILKRSSLTGNSKRRFMRIQEVNNSYTSGSPWNWPDVHILSFLWLYQKWGRQRLRPAS